MNKVVVGLIPGKKNISIAIDSYKQMYCEFQKHHGEYGEYVEVW